MTALPSCTLVSVGPSPSPSSLDWLLEMVLGTDFDRTKRVFPWSIETKYYRAEVLLSILQLTDLLSCTCPSSTYSTTEAVMFYCCDTSKATLELVDRAWCSIKEVSPAVCLLVVESASDQNVGSGQASRTEIMGWCLQHSIELVECDEGEEEDEEDEGIEEKIGRARVVEALKAHTWSNLELLEGGQGRRRGEGEEGSEGDSEEEQVRELVDAVGQEEDDFGALFSQLASMRDRSSNLPPDDRRAYAEQMAMAFYQAIGGGSGDDDSS